MKIIIASILVVFMLACEMHDTVGRLISMNICCKMICTPEDGCDKQDGKGMMCPIMKGCVDFCCYILPDMPDFSNEEVVKNLSFQSQNDLLSDYHPDCFRPPEC